MFSAAYGTSGVHGCVSVATRALAHGAMRLGVALSLVAAPLHAGAQARRDSLSHVRQMPADSAGRTTLPNKTASGDDVLDGLVATALERSPALRAANDRVTAARARIRPAGSREDPMLMAGVLNMPITQPGFSDFMTMAMVGVSQTIPYPGKLGLRTRAAALDADAVRIGLDAARLGVVRAVKDAYYELAYLDHALEIAERNRAVLADVVRVTEAQYGTGKGAQQDVLKARVEAARLAETASMLSEARRATLAQLNVALDRLSETPVERTEIPSRVARAAVATDAASVRFAAQTLGARVAGSPLPSLAALQEMAVEHSPVLREQEARVAAQTARVALARKEYKPDVNVSVQYGYRPNFPDMATLQLSIPLRLQQSAKQDEMLAESSAELSALEAERRANENVVRARVATLASDLERDRTQLALYMKAILPQSRAAVTSALASYQSGRADLLTLLDHQNTVFSYETAYYRALSDFAKELAELDEVVGTEVLP